MATLPRITVVGVKVMRSHDYCHFEISLASDTANTPEAVDELRKTAARLADKAVEQYKVAKTHAAHRFQNQDEKAFLRREVEAILIEPEGDRTPNEQAKVKLLNDEAYWSRRERDYDYEDYEDSQE